MSRAARILALLLLARGAAAAPLPVETFVNVATTLQLAYGADDWATIVALYAPVMVKAMPLEEVRKFFTAWHGEHGRWVKLGVPAVNGRTGVFEAAFDQGTFTCSITLDDAGRIAGLWFAAPRPDLPKPDRNAVLLSLPFRGTWLVTAGGLEDPYNHHKENEAQRHALDLVRVNAEGRRTKGGGGADADFLAWDEEILAPADGVVVEAVDGVPDNDPGVMNGYFVPGNWVVIRHAEHEFSALAHLRRGTIRVKVGQRVRRGQLLGRCGNSGNSSGPHLHFHLMNAAFMPFATGIKPYFDRVELTRSGTSASVRDYAPVTGDTIAP